MKKGGVMVICRHCSERHHPPSGWLSSNTGILSRNTSSMGTWCFFFFSLFGLLNTEADADQEGILEDTQYVGISENTQQEGILENTRYEGMPKDVTKTEQAGISGILENTQYERILKNTTNTEQAGISGIPKNSQ